MNDIAPLVSRLHGMRLPEPPAPDYAGLALAILTVLVVTGILAAGVVWFRQRLPASHHEALALLERAATIVQPAERLTQYATILRRLVLIRSDPKAAASHGVEWLTLLDFHFKTEFFRTGAGHAFGDALYMPDVSVNWADLSLTLPILQFLPMI